MNLISLASGSCGNAYLVEDGNRRLLLEAGIPYPKLQQALWDQGVSLNHLDGCLISHAHGDHAVAAKRLSEMGIECYMSIHSAAKLGMLQSHRVTPAVPHETLHIAHFWQVVPFEVKHDEDSPGTLGFCIDAGGDRLVFVTDANYLRYTIPNVNIWAIEANFDAEILKANIASGSLPPVVAKRTIGSHMSIETAIDLLKANDLSDCRSIVLLHLSGGNSDAREFKRRIEEVTGIPTSIAG